MDAIPQEEIEICRRNACRRLASAMLTCMADNDVESFAQIAARIGQTELVVRGWVSTLSDGRSISLDYISDFFLAMACELVLTVRPRRARRAAPTTTDDEQTSEGIS